jgi:uncharacterized protein (DUF488 family)
VKILLAERVKTVIDVRQVALSRRAEYRKNALRKALSSVGIDYIHIPHAGNPYRHTKSDIVTCLRAYRSYIARRPSVVNQVYQALRRSPSAVLCYEKEHDGCHRSVLLQRIQDKNGGLRLRKVE